MDIFFDDDIFVFVVDKKVVGEVKLGLKIIFMIIKNELIFFFRFLIFLILFMLLFYKKFFGKFFVVLWMVRLINLIVNDYCFLLMKDKWVEWEEWKKFSFIKDFVVKKVEKEEELVLVGSFGV